MFFLQHQSLVGGPNPSCCPICNKLCMTGELLMEHMKFVHKDPNASGVPGEFYSQFGVRQFYKQPALRSALIDLPATQQRDGAQTTRALYAVSST